MRDYGNSQPMILFILLVVAVALIFIVGGPSVQRGLQRDVDLLTEANKYLTGCEIGSVRHLTGQGNHDWSQVWACDSEGMVKAAILVCTGGECSKTLTTLAYPDWTQIDVSVQSGDWVEVR
jgi:hypothetical protein